jgi:hypothetical protein
MLMGSRLLIGAIAALAAFGISVESHADDGPGGYRAKSHQGARHRHQFYGRQVGGYRYWYQHEPFKFSDSNNYPGHYDNQTFWERVQTQRNYPVNY